MTKTNRLTLNLHNIYLYIMVGALQSTHIHTHQLFRPRVDFSVIHFIEYITGIYIDLWNMLSNFFVLSVIRVLVAAYDIIIRLPKYRTAVWEYHKIRYIIICNACVRRITIIINRGIAVFCNNETKTIIHSSPGRIYLVGKCVCVCVCSVGTLG